MDIKIAHVQLMPLLSGVQRVTLDELERLDKSSKRTLICQSRGPLTLAAEESGANVITIPSLVRDIHPLQDLKALWKLWRCFRRERFDVVHTHSSKTGVLGRLAARLAGVPCIVHTVHGFAFPAANSKVQYRIFQAMEWIGGLCSHRVICLHEGDVRICLERLGIPHKNISVLANGIDLDKFSPLPEGVDKSKLRLSLDLPTNRKLILMIGRLWRQKNPSCLIKSYCKLWATGDPGADLVLVGDGELRSDLVNMVHQAGLSDHVHFLGWRDDTPTILNASDIFVLPSLWEGMPLAILEAMGAALPIVASDIPGNRDLVENGKHGLLFPVHDDIALTESLIKLINSDELRNQFGIAGRRKVVSEHDICNRVDKAWSIYRNILSNNV